MNTDREDGELLVGELMPQAKTSTVKHAPQEVARDPNGEDDVIQRILNVANPGLVRSGVALEP